MHKNHQEGFEQIAGLHSQGFKFSRSGMRPKNLHSDKSVGKAAAVWGQQREDSWCGGKSVALANSFGPGQVT